jgi:molybdenum cofactor cytidylyltransferase
MTSNIGAIVLAAGYSRRFRGIKLDARLNNGKTVFQQTLQRLSKNIQPVIIVSRPDVAPLLSPHLTPSSKLEIFDDADQGMGASLAFAAKQITDWDGCLVCLADMPFISSDSYLAIARQIKPGFILTPRHSGKSGNPVAFSAEYFQELRELQGDSGGKSVLRKHQDSIIELELDDGGILLDIDTEEQLQQYQADKY